MLRLFSLASDSRHAARHWQRNKRNRMALTLMHAGALKPGDCALVGQSEYVEGLPRRGLVDLRV